MHECSICKTHQFTRPRQDGQGEICEDCAGRHWHDSMATAQEPQLKR